MMDKCFDEGTIQAFLDGELGSAMIDKVSGHIALCDSCAMAIAEAEQESAYAFAALEKELDTLVPTQRLWTKIEDSIEEEANKRTIWQTLSVYLTGPMAAACASLLIAVGLFIGTIEFIESQSKEFSSLGPSEDMEVQEDLFGNTPFFPDLQPTPKIDVAVGDKDEVKGSPKPSNLVAKNNGKNPVVNARYKATRNGGNGNGGNSNINQRISDPKQTPEPIDDSQFKPPQRYLPGEETYVRTIAALEEKVDERKDFVLKASARFSYEKDLAVANDAIDKMRAEVKKNPKNTAAREVLKTAYQNKIDLLNAVSEKTELLASLD